MKAFFLFLDKNSNAARIFNGVKVTENEYGNFIQLPEIDGVKKTKFKIFLDRENPARIVDGKINELFFKPMGGKNFRDANFITACHPVKDINSIVIFMQKRWPDLGIETLSGRPNGTFPGVIILKPNDAVGFTHKGTMYQLMNDEGKPFMTHLTAKKISKQEPKSQIAKFNQRYGKKSKGGSYTFAEILR